MIKKTILKYKWLSIAVIAIGILISVCSVFSILYYQQLLDAITEGLKMNDRVAGILNYILMPLFFYSIFMIGDCILNYLYGYPQTKLSNSIYQNFKICAVDKISKADYRSLQNFGTGQIIQVVENGASAGRDIIMTFYISILGSQLPRILLSLFLLGIYNIKIMLVIGIGYIFVFMITKLLLKKLYLLKNDTLINQEFMSKRFVICLMEIVTFRVNRMYKKEIKLLEESASKITNNNTKILMVHEAFFTIFYLIIILIKIAIIIISITFSNGVTIGMVVAMVALVDNIYNPIAIFNVAYVDYSLNKITFDRYKKFMDLPDDTNLFHGKQVEDIVKDIVVEHVSFQYDERTVVNDISFNIVPGKSVAIVGESGSGKSTIIKMLMGLIKYSEGAINIDNTLLKDINLNSLYKNITYISQDTPVFDANIRRNIVFDKEVNDNEVYSALSLVKLDEFIQSQPQRLDTEISEKGIKLSGGEKQRIALARIFFDNNKIVILDEATSGMDYITEEFVMRNLYQNISNKMFIIVAHRLNIVKEVDIILVMKNGTLIQQGTFDQLIGDTDGYFYSLWQKQETFKREELYNV